jgi:hypothetical protein
MKKIAALLAAGLMCLSASAVDVPNLIGSGFEAYKASGSKAAVAVWLRSAPAGANINTSGLPPDIGPGVESPDAWGPMDSYEIVAAFSPTARLRRIYAVAYFPQGPLFCSFDLYKVSGAWTVYATKFSPRPDEVLPVELIEKSN